MLTIKLNFTIFNCCCCRYCCVVVMTNAFAFCSIRSNRINGVGNSIHQPYICWNKIQCMCACIMYVYCANQFILCFCFCECIYTNSFFFSLFSFCSFIFDLRWFCWRIYQHRRKCKFSECIIANCMIWERVVYFLLFACYLL